jgi:hypothetical protein
MAILQWQRAKFMVEQMKEADRSGTDIAAFRSELKRMTELKFGWCHDCLLLAVYDLYKNGFIEGTIRAKAKEIDLAGFNGHESADICHAFDSLELLRKDNKLTASDLKRILGGEQSIYSFVVHYFRNGLLRLNDW